MPSPEIQLRALKLLEQNPHLSQRELSAELGFSLGKTHYVVKALVDLGWVKLRCVFWQVDRPSMNYCEKRSND
jgi:DNA-binding Lrp family transcriptional regulator